MTPQTSSKPPHVTIFPYLLLVAVGTIFVISNLDNTTLLYMNELGYTTKQDDSFYVTTTAIGLLAPPLSALALGELSNRYGPGYALMLGFRTLILGFILILIARVKSFVLVLGYAIGCLSQSFRVLRFTIISDLFPARQRTYYMAIHQLMIPIGALISPTVWLLVQKWRAHIVLIPDLLVLDRFTVTYLISMLTCLVMAWLCYAKLRVDTHMVQTIDDSIQASQQSNQPDSNTPLVSSSIPRPTLGQTESTVSNTGKETDYGATNAVHVWTDPGNEPHSPSSEIEANALRHSSSQVVNIYLADGSTQTVDLLSYRNTRISFFAILLLCLRFTYAFVLVVFQPALINRFHADDAEVGRTFWLISVLSFVPPLMVASLSRVAQDRQILLFGLVLKLVGFMLYLPIFGEVSKWGIIVGYILVVKASMFCVSASISLFSKVLGPFCSGQTIGFLWSISSFFPASVQMLYSTQIMHMFSTWRYALFCFPAVLAVVMVIVPSGWRLLDPDLEYNRLVVHAAKKRIDA